MRNGDTEYRFLNESDNYAMLKVWNRDPNDPSPGLRDLEVVRRLGYELIAPIGDGGRLWLARRSRWLRFRAWLRTTIAGNPTHCAWSHKWDDPRAATRTCVRPGCGAVEVMSHL